MHAKCKAAVGGGLVWEQGVMKVACCAQLIVDRRPFFDVTLRI